MGTLRGPVPVWWRGNDIPISFVLPSPMHHQLSFTSSKLNAKAWRKKPIKPSFISTSFISVFWNSFQSIRAVLNLLKLYFVKDRSKETQCPYPPCAKFFTGRNKQKNFLKNNVKNTNWLTEGFDKFMSLNSSLVVTFNSRCLGTTNYNKSGNCSEEKIVLNMSSLLHFSISSSALVELGGCTQWAQLHPSVMLMFTLCVKPLQKIVWFWYRKADNRQRQCSEAGNTGLETQAWSEIKRKKEFCQYRSTGSNENVLVYTSCSLYQANSIKDLWDYDKCFSLGPEDHSQPWLQAVCAYTRVQFGTIAVSIMCLSNWFMLAL